MTTATLSAPSNTVVAFPAKALPTVRNLTIEGITKQAVNETRLFHTAPALPANKPRSATKLLAKLASKQQKLPEASFRLIETVDASLEMLMAVKLVSTGLKNNETVLLVSPEKPEYLMRKLTMTGLDAEKYVASGKLILFSSQPAIAGNMSLATNYRKVFGELFNLADRPVDRIIMLRMDLLVNLESQYLAYASVSKFTQAADEMGCKFIAQYSRNQSEAHDRLDAACSSLVNAYFVMKRGEQRKHYQLQSKNMAA